jgi:hypothetical protein
MVMVGALALAAAALIFAWRDGNPALVRLGFRSALLGALPGYVVMRVGAEWIADKENLTDSNDTWIGIGYGSSDVGLLVLLVATLLAWLAVRRTRAAEAAGGGGTGGTAAVLTALLVLAYLVTVWAMTTKPV